MIFIMVKQNVDKLVFLTPFRPEFRLFIGHIPQFSHKQGVSKGLSYGCNILEIPSLRIKPMNF